MRVAVVGAGVMGCATAWALSKRGAEVTLHEQFALDHDRGSSHGRTRIFRVAYPDPSWIRFAQEAFNLAERFQTIVFCMSDLDLGMNNWMSDPFAYPDDIAIDRGKVLTAGDLERLGSFQRYLDVDGDAIPYRTIPRTDHPAAAYFARGSGHNANAVKHVASRTPGT